VASYLVLAVFAGCRGRSPDAGGDTSLARDLAEVQLAGVASNASSTSTRGVRGTVQGADSVGARAALPTASKPVVAPLPAGPQGASAAAHAIVPAAKVARADPCASSTPADQSSCLSLSERRAGARLSSLQRSITTAVRRQQRVPARAADPPYVSELAQAQKKWISWRDSECRRRTNNAASRLRARASCVTELTDARVAELNRILSQLRHRR
jgi:uncharacterized protein YecT (DUF1311 family)